ncbi:hypothetical protein AVEN_205079-1 [Araneus ventricosus]|uniref:Reverse transcriptase/retrotransposon-derived protein RNase H-like domain-containing protein n=1 Tax=Araneus ventricosus TaxID=182803 RepID=A0A4Y2H2S2_ARAVE|nr:hypothetical protein AVEN_205079-1 [Araneus ventricosus]
MLTIHFACDRVKLLGHWITVNGIEVDQEKLSAIETIPVPTNVKEVQSFLQTVSWFRRYVPNFSNITRPLMFKQPDGSKPFRIHTDASSYALGAALAQGEGPEEHVINYASHLLIPVERNYSTTEHEALAVIWALEKF